MSSDTPNAPSPRDRREAVREKAQQVRAQQSRARLVRRSALALGAVAAVAAIAIVVTWAVSSAMSRPQLSPQNLDDDGFAVTSITGAVSAPLELTQATPTPTATPTPAAEETDAAAVPAVEIDVYVDYLSPGAREWQIANAQQIASWVNDGAVTLAYHPVSMLTAKSNGTKYSLRAAGAAACVATYSPATFFTFNGELLTRQPAVDSDGFSDEELADLAQAAGVEDPKKVRACIQDGAYISWVKNATERAVSGIPGTDDLGLTGTPMILVNGQQYVGVLGDAAEFSQFVLTSASDAFYKSQSTPSPTVSPTP